MIGRIARYNPNVKSTCWRAQYFPVWAQCGLSDVLFFPNITRFFLSSPRIQITLFAQPLYTSEQSYSRLFPSHARRESEIFLLDPSPRPAKPRLPSLRSKRIMVTVYVLKPQVCSQFDRQRHSLLVSSLTGIVG
jgi:hypothetical protein